MGQSFTGTPFDQGVKTQIETRQKSLGKYTNIPSKDLQYYTTKTPFLRLASSVDLEFYSPLKGVPKQLKDLGYDVGTWDGDYLAKNIILQGGVASYDKDKKKDFLQAGLNNGSSIFNGAYGWGGTSERGYIPMPGITNADVTYYNNGALSKTTINIKCYSKAQFQLIDILYLRPGYTLLMEFGHSVWLDKKQNLKSMDSFLTEPMSKFLSPDEGTNQYEIYQSIKTARETYDYNYEAFFGQISNFNWQFNSDGSYDCQVQLTSIGDVIASLKCNITDPSIPDIDVNENKSWWEKHIPTSDTHKDAPPLVSNANKTTINRELFKIYQSAQMSKPKTNTLIDYTLSEYVGVDENGKPETPTSLKFEKGLLAIPGTTTDIKQNESPQVYIKYGAFLAYLQSKVLLYDKKTDTPLVVFDMDFKNLDKDENVIFKVPGQFSADPRVCIIPYSNTNIGEGVTLPQTKINEVVSATAWEYQTYLGRVGNIMVNVNFLATCLVDASDEKGNINVIDYLKSINNGLITALGDINEFKIKLSDDGLKLIFNENIPQRRTPDTPTSEYTRFNVYGVKPGIEGSFIRNVSLNASIPSNFATMISIGAQSNGNQLSENATSFSNYNMGLADRIIKVKESIYPKKTPTTEDEVDEVTIKTNFDDNINASNEEGASLFLKIYGDTSLKFLNDNIGSLVSHNKTHASLLVGKLTKDNQIQAPFFLPFNFQLEMDGLSGMKLYQKFLMTDDILPPTYANDGVDLQITGINHKIDTSAWITEVTTQSVAAETLGAPARPKQLVSSATTQQSSNLSNSLPLSNTEAPASQDPESITRFNAMQASYNWVFSRDGEVKSMCARWSYNLALNYIKYLKGYNPEKRQLAAGGNANNNNEYYNNLTALGYTKTQSVVTKSQLLNSLATRTWGYGDIVAYYCNDGPKNQSHVKYGHTQVYVGTINSVGWTTSTKNNYNTDFPYRSREGNNWTYLIFTAPAA